MAKGIGLKAQGKTLRFLKPDTSVALRRVPCALSPVFTSQVETRGEHGSSEKEPFPDGHASPMSLTSRVQGSQDVFIDRKSKVQRFKVQRFRGSGSGFRVARCGLRVARRLIFSRKERKSRQDKAIRGRNRFQSSWLSAAAISCPKHGGIGTHNGLNSLPSLSSSLS